MILALLLLLLPSQLGIHFWPSWSFVQGVRVDYLSPTIFLTDILIIWLFVTSKLRPRVPLYIILFVVLNILVSHSPAVSVYKWLRVYEYYWLYKYMISRNSLFIIRNSLAIAVLWTSALAWTQFILQKSVGGLLYWLGERTFDITTPGIAKIDFFGHLLLRPYATLPHPNALAGFLLLTGLLTLYLTFQNRLKISYWPVILAALTVPITFSRTGIFLEAAVILWLIVKSKIKTIYKFMLFILLFVICYLLFPLGSPSSLPDRLALIDKSLSIIHNSPLIGVGLGNFIPYNYVLSTNNYQLTTQPVHNVYLLFASELGIPASLLISLIITKSLTLTFFKNKILFASLLVVLVSGIVDHYWTTLHQNILLVLILISLFREPRTN